MRALTETERLCLIALTRQPLPFARNAYRVRNGRGFSHWTIVRLERERLARRIAGTAFATARGLRAKQLREMGR